MSRVRAIEQGVPLVRAANTGISAVIDPYGRILDHLPLGVAGIIDADLPKPASNDPLFRTLGDWPVGGLTGAILIALFLSSRGRRSRLTGRPAP